MTWLRQNSFLFGLAAAVALAWVFPAAGAKGGWLHTEITIKAGVGLIFFLTGLALSLDALKHGLLRWRLHALAQAWIFLLFPLTGLLFDRLFGGGLAPGLRLGFLFLCALPTTISTAIVLTSLAGGNTAGAVFNATLANLLGIVITPVWAGWLARTGGQPLPAGPVIREIMLLLLAPLAAGQALRPLARRWIDAWKTRVGAANSAVILFIVHAAFADSVQARLWESYGAGVVLTALAGAALLFVFVTGAVYATGRAARLDRPDAIAMLFCASQKTLAAGVPMAQLIFGAHPALGLVLLPLLLYHPLQLAGHGIIASRLGRSTPPDRHEP